jgi:hypothetical protein
MIQKLVMDLMLELLEPQKLLMESQQPSPLMLKHQKLNKNLQNNIRTSLSTQKFLSI